MDSKTILIVDHDALLRRQVRDLLAGALPKAKIVEYILAERVLSDLKTSSVDMLITGDKLLDSDGDALARAARLQIPLLPIITLFRVSYTRPQPRLMGLHHFVPKSDIEDLLMPAVVALLHSDSMAFRSAAWLRTRPSRSAAASW